MQADARYLGNYWVKPCLTLLHLLETHKTTCKSVKVPRVPTTIQRKDEEEERPIDHIQDWGGFPK
jgi:hypothetical protein